MDIDSDILFKNAKVYVSIPENEYLKGTIFRKKIGPIACSFPIRLTPNRILLQDHQIIQCDGIEVEAIYAPGHSAGHTAYRIDSMLFAGDCLIFDGHVGWCFYDFWNWNTKINIQTLKMLDNYCKQNKIQQVITSHSGMLDASLAFQKYDQTPNWKVKGFQFIPDAEEDVYHM